MFNIKITAQYLWYEKGWKSQTRLSGKYARLLSHNDKSTKVFRESAKGNTSVLIQCVLEEVRLDVCVDSSLPRDCNWRRCFWRSLMRFHLLRDLNVSAEWERKGVTTAAYGRGCEESRNPLIHRSYSIGIIPSVTFVCFYVLLSIPQSTVWFQSLLLCSYKRCYVVHLVYDHWKRFFKNKSLLRYLAWRTDNNYTSV